MSTTSGRRRCAAATASSPSSASPTTSMPCCRSRNARRPSRTTAWSSTTRTRIGSAPTDLEAHRRAGARRGADVEPPTEALGALLHRRQPEPARAQHGDRGVEADAVVRDLEHDAAVVAVQPDCHVPGLRVAQSVLQGLLGDPQDLAVACRIEWKLVVEIELDLVLLQPAQHLDVLAQRAAE